jgi:hypothetical protein
MRRVPFILFLRFHAVYFGLARASETELEHELYRTRLALLGGGVQRESFCKFHHHPAHSMANRHDK